MVTRVYVTTGTVPATLKHGNGVTETLGAGQRHGFALEGGSVSIAEVVEKRQRKPKHLEATADGVGLAT